MIKYIGTLSTVLFGTIFSVSLVANPITDLTRCSQISDKNDRLDCFDTLADYYKGAKQPSSSSAISPTNPSQLVDVPNTSSPSSDRLQAIESAEDRFGKKEQDGVESIESNIIGSFSGWEKGMKLKLANGQVWKVISQRTGYKKMENPKIVISIGAWGSYNAKVEGLNARAKVKRIK